MYLTRKKSYFTLNSLRLGIFTALIKSAGSYVFWIFLAGILIPSELNSFSLYYGVAFAFLGIVDMGISSIAQTEISQDSRKNDVWIFTLLFHGLMIILISIIYQLFIKTMQSELFLLSLISVYAYMLLWPFVRKVTESFGFSIQAQMHEIALAIVLNLGIVFIYIYNPHTISNYQLFWYIFCNCLGISLILIYRFRKYFFSKPEKSFASGNVVGRIKHFFLKTKVFIIPCIVAFLYTYFERIFLSKGNNNNDIVQYVLTICQQIMAFFIFPVAGMINQIWRKSAILNSNNKINHLSVFVNRLLNIYCELALCLLLFIILWLRPLLFFFYSFNLSDYIVIFYVFLILGFTSGLGQLLGTVVNGMGLFREYAKNNLYLMLLGIFLNLFLLNFNFFSFHGLNLGLAGVCIKIIVINFLTFGLFVAIIKKGTRKSILHLIGIKLNIKRYYIYILPIFLFVVFSDINHEQWIIMRVLLTFFLVAGNFKTIMTLTHSSILTI